MASVNYCAFIGVAGSDPRCRTFESGNKVANVNIAVSEKYKTRDGEVKESTEWIPLVLNDKLADVAEKYIRKGSLVYVSGKFRTRKYTNHDGVEVSATEIVVRELQLLSKREDNATEERREQPREERPAPAPAPQNEGGDDLPW
jgi:single-strand DNA-binding protein